MKKGDSYRVADAANTKHKIIDSVGKVFSIVEQLADKDSGLREWEFLRKWDSFTLEEKHKKHDKYMSHEMNLFLYFKDPVNIKFHT